MATEYQYECCLIGGTFDRFHSGHKLLISAALTKCQSVEIYITTDEMALKKSLLIQDYLTRFEQIYSWINDNYPNRVKLFELEDRFGPAPIHETADAIAATPETVGNCHKINETRISNGLEELAIIEVPHLFAYDGSIVSSSLIRRGKLDQDGNPWLDVRLTNSMLKMSSLLDSELKTPMGELFRGPEEHPEIAMSEALEYIDRNLGNIVAVGDVSVKVMIDMGNIPDVGIIDGMTKRKSLDSCDEVSLDSFQNLLKCQNPPGHLTHQLAETIDSALTSDGPVAIVVDGEEDLAPLLIHCLAPIGTAVIYGQPNQGVVVQITTLEVKERCRNLLALFEEI